MLKISWYCTISGSAQLPETEPFADHYYKCLFLIYLIAWVTNMKGHIAKTTALLSLLSYTARLFPN
jgi:hypothetical protein